MPTDVLPSSCIHCGKVLPRGSVRYCSDACEDAVMEAMGWESKTGTRKQPVRLIGVATCPRCARRIYGDQCYKCHWKAS